MYKWLKKSVAFCALLALLFFLLNFIFPFKVDLTYSKLIYDKNDRLIHAYMAEDEQWRMFIELNEITPELKKAIIEKEDKYFYYHPGVNPIAIFKALVKNTTSGKRKSGASTITMQVARMLNRKERTYWNKLVEMFNALQLELNYTKDEILQLYLNKIPLGGNVEGVKAASYIYFDKNPDLLSLAECVALSVIPEDPLDLTPGKHNAAIRSKRNVWLTHFKDENIFPLNDIQLALEEPFEYKRGQTPRLAPHFSRRMQNELGNNIRTSLDIEKQLKIQKICKNYTRHLASFDIHNVCALVVENDSNLIRAYIGSADFKDSQHAGQVDGVQAIRSPGSTLKPLLYGLSFDKGLLTPKSIIHDVPSTFAMYEPENYDGTFNGPVTVSKALSESLNVPAVKVLEELSESHFIDILIKAGFKSIAQNKNNLGLSMVLGGCGVTLEELTTLYADFARNGNHMPLNFTSETFKNDSVKILSSSATYMLADIMKKVSRPDLASEWQNTEDLPSVAWKTGTSYGRRDAWSIGFNNQYTVAVWVGNFSGKGIPELSGAQMASPLFFDIFNYISKSQDEHWHLPDDNLEFRRVCSVTGNVPGEFCKDLTDDLYLPGISHYKECKHSQKAFVSIDSSLTYCTDCLPESGYISAIYPHFHPEIAAWYNKKGVEYLRLPKHNPLCERQLNVNPPKIISPVHGIDYYINKKDSTELMLEAQAGEDVKEIFWYLNDKLVKATRPNEKLFVHPPRGEVKISCSDDRGRNTDIFVNIKLANF